MRPFCDRCGRPGATVEHVQEGSRWWYHPECERPTPLEPDGVLDAAEVMDLQRCANRVEDIPACDVIRIVRAYQAALRAKENAAAIPRRTPEER